MTVSPPIIVNETSDPHRAGDVFVLNSVEEAVGYLEAIDVENNEYIAYDSEGRLLRLGTRDRYVTIEAADAVPEHQAQLRSILTQAFLRVGDRAAITQDWVESATLSELVERARALWHPEFSSLWEIVKEGWEWLLGRR